MIADARKVADRLNVGYSLTGVVARSIPDGRRLQRASPACPKQCLRMLQHLLATASVSSFASSSITRALLGLSEIV